MTIEVFESGTWSLSKDKLTLTNSYGEKSYYLPREDKLVMLDIDGNVINSGLNYTLAKVQPKQLAGNLPILLTLEPLKIANLDVSMPLMD